MASSFPGSADAFTNPTGTDALDSSTVPHATQHADVNDAIEAVEGFLLRNADPDIAPVTPDSCDDEFEGGGSIDGKWTKVNDPAGADALNQTDFSGFLHVGLIELTVTDNFDALVRLHQSPPSGDGAWELVAKLAMSATGMAVSDGEWAFGGVYLGSSVDDVFVASVLEVNDQFPGSSVLAQGVTNGASGSIATMSTVQKQLPGPTNLAYVRLTKPSGAYSSALTYRAYFSLNGLTWWEVGSQSKTFTNAPDEIGLSFRRPRSQGGDPKVEALVDWFRRLA